MLNSSKYRFFDCDTLIPLEKQSVEEQALLEKMYERIKALSKNYNVKINMGFSVIEVTPNSPPAPEDNIQCQAPASLNSSGLTLTKSRHPLPKKNSMYYSTKGFESWTL